MEKLLHVHPPFLLFIMRVTLIPIITVLAFSGVALATESLGQEALKRKISVQAEDQEMSGLLARIEEAADIRFIYSPEVIPVREKVTLKADNDALGDVLKKLLAPYRVAFEAVDNQIVLRKQEAAQTVRTPEQSFEASAARTITGKITDENNSPLPGVSVLIKGTTTGTVTDADGIYSLSISSENEGGTLVISFIGYATQEVLIDNREAINIQMEPDVQSLQEVVVVGVSLKEKDLTGAVVNVDEKVLRERPVTNINEALQGKAAGVFVQNNPEPGQNAYVRVRGNNSMQFGAAPLYVVDGVMMDRDFQMLNLNDVASINVLKDASSTAMYGLRGANGVILITTKKGKSGEGKVSYDGWYGVSSLRNKDLTLGTKDVFDLRVEAMENSSVGAAFYAANPGATRADFIRDGRTGTDPTAPFIFADYERDAYAGNRNYNWLDAVTRSAVQQNHSLSFSGGTEKGSYYFSLGYSDQQGTVRTSDYKRYTGRINLDQNIKKWLKVGTNTTFTRGEENLVDGKVFGVARGANPMLPTSVDSLYLAWGNNWDVNQENPLKSLTIEKKRTKNRIITSNYISINPLKHFTVRSAYTVDFTNQPYYEYIPSNIQQAKRDSYRGKATHNYDQILNWQWDNSVSYENQFGKSNVSAFVSYNLNKNDYFYTNLSVRDFPIDGFSYYNLGAGTDKANVSYGSGLIDPYATMSYVARVNYEYDGRYMVTGTVRRDGTSKFADGYRWGTFPSIALAWNITNESFMSGQTLLNMAKLRAGYGGVGNQGIPAYAPYSLYNPQYSNGQVTFSPSSRRGTRDISWEKQKQLNIGIDLATWGNRLSFTAEYFNIVNSNLLIRRTVSNIISGGFSEAYENVGEMTNKGLEFTVNALVVDAGDFKWNLSANLSKDRNKVTKLYNQVDAIYNAGGFTGNEIQREGNYFLGQSVNTIYMYEFDRIIQQSDMEYVHSLGLDDGTNGKTLKPGDILPRDINGDGEITPDKDRVVVGRKDPKFYGGFTTNFAWKGLSLNAIFTYSYGAKKLSYLYEALMSGTGMTAMHKDELDRWTPQNTNTNIPRLTYDASAHYGAGETSWSVQNASFLRLSTISLSYDLPKNLVGRAGLSDVRIYVTGTNLGLWTKYKGYDPENGDDYPTSKMTTVGLNLSF
jgi:TonB-dependent starch-binding outer membrane protein SusC